MGSSGATKPHAVCVPFPAQGHVNPMMQLAKLLHAKGFHVTFVNTEFNHKRLIRSRGPEFLLLKLKSLSEVPPVSCIVSDGIMSFGIKAAEEFGIPQVQFWTSSTCSFMMDGNAIANLHLALADGVLSSMAEKKTTKEICDTLTKLYEAKSLHNKIFLKRKLYTLRMMESTMYLKREWSLNLKRRSSV
ncbi:hypothetical protein UlMin_038327 [Ulmus minor]